jgi:hypothetical protein
MRRAALLAATLALVGVSTTTHALPLVNFGEMWSYWPDSLGDPNVNYTRPSFTPTALWRSGKTPIGFGDTSLATFLPVTSTNMVTFYARKVVTLNGYVVAANGSLLVDDGAVVYVNGVEVFRSNLPLGSLTRVTPATTSVGGADEKKLLTFTIAASRFVLGNNVIAVEVHNAFKVGWFGGAVAVASHSPMAAVPPSLPVGAIMWGIDHTLPRPTHHTRTHPTPFADLASPLPHPILLPPPLSTCPPPTNQSFDMRFNLGVDYTPAPSATPSPAAMVDSIAIPRRSVWQFTEKVADAVTGWNTQAFSDGLWSYGPGPLGFGDTQVGGGGGLGGRVG